MNRNQHNIPNLLQKLNNIINNFNILKLKILKEVNLKSRNLYLNHYKKINSKIIIHVQHLKISPITF